MSQQITKAEVQSIRFKCLCAPEPGVLTEELPGYSLIDVPGLGVCRSVTSKDGLLQQEKKGSWSVFHLHSGRKIGMFWPTAMQALIVVRALKGVADWTKTAEELIKTSGLNTAVSSILQDFNNALARQP